LVTGVRTHEFLITTFTPSCRNLLGLIVLLRLLRVAVRYNQEEGRVLEWAVWSSSMLVNQPLKPGNGLQAIGSPLGILVATDGCHFSAPHRGGPELAAPNILNNEKVFTVF
jgi:hypothetical protein